MGAVKADLMDALDRVGECATVLLDAQPPTPDLWEEAYWMFCDIADAMDDDGKRDLLGWAKEYAATDFADDYTRRAAK